MTYRYVFAEVLIYIWFMRKDNKWWDTSQKLWQVLYCMSHNFFITYDSNCNYIWGMICIWNHTISTKMGPLFDNYNYWRGKKEPTQKLSLATYNHNNKSLAALSNFLVWEKKGTKVPYHEEENWRLIQVQKVVLAHLGILKAVSRDILLLENFLKYR